MSLSENIPTRLAEAAAIDAEWNAMSYKDRVAWWVSAKWYGYQSKESYCRGDIAQPNESCRYGEPGFLIGTRVPYFEVTAAAPTAEVSVTTTEPSIESKPSSEVSASTKSTNAPNKKKKKKHHNKIAAGDGKTINISLN